MAQNINEQLNLLNKSALDVRQTTLQSVSDLASYAYFTYAYDGLEVTVLNDGHPVKFAINSNGSSRIRKSNWTISSTIVADTYQDLADFCDNVVTTLSISSSNKSKAFVVGQKAIVLADETRDGGWSEYIAVAVNEGIPTWDYNHADPQKLAIVANSADTSVELYYDGVKVGDAADLSGILTQWQYDQFIASGGIVTENEEQFIELYYNDETLNPIRINVTDFASTQEGPQGPQGKVGPQGPQGPAGTYEAGEGVTIENGVISVGSVSGLTELQQKLSVVSGDVNNLRNAIAGLDTGDKNVIEEVQVNGTPLEVVDKSVNVVISGFATTSEVESAITQALEPYATSAITTIAIENAVKPSIQVDNYSAATAIATSDNVGRVLNVLNEQEISGETYSSGLYIVTGAGEISKLGTTSATGDVEGDVEMLKGRVGNLESAMYWLTDEDLVIE